MIKKLKICGFDFVIKYKDSVMVDNENCLGCCKSDSGVIELKKGIQKSKKNEVILHEAIHAMSDTMDLNLSEKTVNTLGVVIINFIKENKNFIKQIMESK